MIYVLFSVYMFNENHELFTKCCFCLEARPQMLPVVIDITHAHQHNGT